MLAPQVLPAYVSSAARVLRRRLVGPQRYPGDAVAVCRGMVDVRGVLQRSDWRYQLRVGRIGGYDDVRSIVSGSFDRALPTFARRVSGVDPG
jgi:hypothetical protein